MSLIGKTLGTFECTALLGKGGMGEVYRAKDQKLGRDVAVKVLPEEFAKDADRVARFQREAKLLASLNHPNIAAIHGLEESEGTHFLVLELIEGDTLTDRLKHGAIPVEESLKLALQIAEALEAAHEKGVIHRDLKPANIKVTPDGKVKVLDFGLAKAYAGEQEKVDLSHSPTLSDAATQQGMILGTAAYMSPEQARGKQVDKRADVWAFGCVLFEMLTGRATFSGRDVTDILAAVIRAEPEWKSLPQNLHWRLKEVLERSLEKEAKDRYGSINDARVDIQKVLSDSSDVLMQPITAVESRMKLRQMLPWIAATLVLSAIIVWAVIWNLKPTLTPELRQVNRFHYELPESQQFRSLSARILTISPDGSKFVYSTRDGLCIRSMDGLDASLIPGTDEDAEDPFFSPDGQWVGYWSPSDNQLKKIAISGGAPIPLTAAAKAWAPSWGVDNMIVYAQLGEGVFQVSANGGTPEILIESTNEYFALPQILPDGKSILLSLLTAERGFQVVVQSLESGERKILAEGDTAQYLKSGHVSYVVGNNLFAIPFDYESLQVLGGPVSMVEGVLRGGDAPQYSVSNTGTLVYVPGPGGESSGYSLVWVDRAGKEEPLSAQPDYYRQPRISPDGTQLALTINIGGNLDIRIWDLARETMMRLTFDEAFDSFPLWTPDGRRIVFASSREEGGVYLKAADGTGEVERLVSVSDRSLLPWSWSSDGKTLVFFELGGSSGTGYDIGALPMEGDHTRKLLLQEKYNEFQPKISPDGRWMAYTSNESGQNEIYIRPFPEVNKGRWQASTSGGHSPLWSPDGQELFYLNSDAEGTAVMAISVATEPTFKRGKPEVLFRGMYVGLTVNDAHTWHISPDGKRFLMMKPPSFVSESYEEGGPRKITIVLNWFEELKERVPVD